VVAGGCAGAAPANRACGGAEGQRHGVGVEPVSRRLPAMYSSVLASSPA
jgi:hypothetical protein